MFWDRKTAPTASATDTTAILFTHPWPRDNRPNMILQCLSESFNNAWRAPSSTLAKAFSFCKDRLVECKFQYHFKTDSKAKVNSGKKLMLCEIVSSLSFKIDFEESEDDDTNMAKVEF